MADLKGGKQAGGDFTRRTFSKIFRLGKNNPNYKITAAAIHNKKIIIEITGDNIELLFILEEFIQSEKKYYLNTTNLSLYFIGKDIPLELQNILNNEAKQELQKYTFESLKQIFIQDKDLGSPTEKLPTSDESGEEKFKSKALLSSWGSPDSWYNFFASAEIARCQLDSLDFFDTCKFVQHCDNECIFVSPELGVPIMEMVHYPWKDREKNKSCVHEKKQKKEQDDEFNMYMTDIDEYDIIMGKSNDKLIAALEHSTSQPHNSFILCSNTCVPIVAGEDVESIVKRYQKISNAPLLFLTCTASSMENLFNNLFTNYKHNNIVNDRKNKQINLVGYAEKNDLKELINIVNEFGIKINTTIIPHLDLETVKKYNDADLDIIYMNNLWDHIFNQLTDTSQISSIKPLPPYGILTTKNWLEDICTSLNITKNINSIWEKYYSKIEEQFIRQKKLAEKKHICFVIDGEEAFRLTDPSYTWGIPLLKMIEEMGFGIFVYIYATDKTTAYQSAKEVQDNFMDPEKHTIKAFNTSERFVQLLEINDIDAVYSDYFFDWRISDAGKSQFSMQIFEMGLQGMIRSQERLLNICNNKFFKKYKKYFKNSHSRNSNQSYYK